MASAPLPLLLLLCLIPFSRPHPDTQTLLTLKRSLTDPKHALTTWTNTTSPCLWTGVTCTSNRVHRLNLSNRSLTGSITPLSNLTHLRLLSLSHNNLSGEIPSLPLRLSRLDLSFNSLNTALPVIMLNEMNHLITLRIEANRFSGTIVGLEIPNLQDFNVSRNNISGEIPKSLAGFPISAFSDNVGLCGGPLGKCRVVSSDPTQPGSENPERGKTPVVSSDSSSISAPGVGVKKGRKLGKFAVVGIIVGDVLVLVLIGVAVYLCFWRKRIGGQGKKKKGVTEGEKIVYSSSPYPVAQHGVERGKMVFFDSGKRFELEDLLRASAEMLGKGGSGTAYKAVMEDGDEVAVKRMRDGGGGGKREFEEQMEVIGRLRHGNLVGLKAYYYARDEKLLVFEYMPNGSLFWLLHGNRGPGRTPLDWTTRLKIAAGAAKGLAYIHSSLSGSAKLTHGNIKSTNILLDRAGNARVSDFGLSMFSSPSSSTSKSNGYRAPESSDARKITQKADVYSFGVLLLEMLTGKCPTMGDHVGSVIGYSGVVDLPRWVQSVVREEWTAEVFDLELMRYKDIEEEMVGLLQIAMACTSAAPDQRPKMSHVVKMIEEIRGAEVSPSHDASDSVVSDSPSVSEDAGGVSQ